jgi:hypothetical protein
MSESSDGHDFGTSTFRQAQFGVRWRPAPASVPVLAGSFPVPAFPSSFDWAADLDLTGEDGSPDALGNLSKPTCVPCAALRMMQLHTADGRKPTEAQADALFKVWGGTEFGAYPDQAFDHWGRHGFAWADQRQIVPRLSVVERDGVATNLALLRTAIYALGGVIGIFRMPRSAMNNFSEWLMPRKGSSDAEDMGHHAVLITGADLAAFRVVSWGMRIQASYPFVLDRLAQAWAFPNAAWARAGTSPSGLTFDQIRALGAKVGE